jgi:hypothetical protein
MVRTVIALALGTCCAFLTVLGPRDVQAQAAGGGTPAPSPASRSTVWDGAYTEAQAQRGAKAYSEFCVDCHKADLKGDKDAPSLAGDEFIDDFREAPLALLFDRVSTFMPDDSPGSLPANAYLDVMTYLLQKHAIPAGTEELTEARLGAIWLYKQTGPGTIPDQALVAVSGCLTPGQDSRQWSLTRASMPVRVATPEPAPLKPAPALEGNTGTYQLRPSKPSGPITWDDLGGQQVTVRGFLQRQGSEQGLGVTHVRSIRPSCTAQ